MCEMTSGKCLRSLCNSWLNSRHTFLGACFSPRQQALVLSREETPVFALCPKAYRPFSAPRIFLEVLRQWSLFASSQFSAF